MVAIISIYFLAVFATAVTAMGNFKKTSPYYRPMLIFIASFFVFDILQVIFGNDSLTSKILANVQYLLESILICWQAKRWGVFNRRPWMFGVLVFLLLNIFVSEKVASGGTDFHISWFRAFYSFVAVLLGIELLNRSIFNLTPLLKNPVALFSIGIVFYYIFSGLLEVFMIIGQYSSQDMTRMIYIFYAALGIVTHLVYLRSLLCIPKQANLSLS